MKHVASIAGRELRSLFVSPVAYGVLSLFAVVAGVFFILNVAWFTEQLMLIQRFQAFDQAQQLNLNDHVIAELYASMSVVLLFLIPGITMGLFAAEKANGTEELLLTSPLTIWEIVLGKFLGGALFVAVMVAIVGVFPAILYAYGDPEVPRILSGLLGLLLVAWVYVAVGAFASSITRSQIVAFMITFVLLLCLMLLPAFSDLGVASGASWAGDFFRYLSTTSHVEQLNRGLVSTADLAYFAVLIASFVLLTKASLESQRWR